ncbi:MAG: hypothetical protein ACI8YQ_003362 [Polaribacter sp.]
MVEKLINMRVSIFLFLVLISCSVSDIRPKVFELIINDEFDKSKPIEIPSNLPLTLRATNVTSEEISIGYNINGIKGRSKEVQMIFQDNSLVEAKGYPITGHDAVIGYDTLLVGASHSYPFVYNARARYPSSYKLYIFIYGEKRNNYDFIMNIDDGVYEAYIINTHQDGYLECYQVTAEFKDKNLVPIPFSGKDKLNYPMVSTERIGVTVNKVGQFVYSKK